MIAIVTEFKRVVRENGAFVAETQANPDGGDNVTFDHYGPSGDDAPPLDSDSVGGFRVQDSGRAVAAGYADTQNEGSAEKGEVRRYARDSTGKIVASFHMRNDGSYIVSNENGRITISAEGEVELRNENGVFTLGDDGSLQGTNAGGSFLLTVGGAFNASIKSFRFENESGALSMDEGGEINANGVSVDTDGNVQTSGIVTADTDVFGGGKSLATHIHGGSPTAPDGPVSNTQSPV